MIPFLTNNWQVLSAAAVALLGINFGPQLLSTLGNIKLPGVSAKTTGVPSRREVLDDLDGAFAFFEKVGCKEGMDAIKLAVGHAFEHKEPEAQA